MLRELALAAALIATVEAGELPGWPDYSPVPELPLGEQTLTLIIEVVPDADAACGELGIEPDPAAGPAGHVVGCASWGTESCTITVEPDVSDKIIAHELKHCLLGGWHQ
jgi:hypothetical protein